MISPLEHPTWEAQINENIYEITLSYDESPYPVTQWFDLFRDSAFNSKIPVVIYRTGRRIYRKTYMPNSDYATYSNDSDFREELHYRLEMIDNGGVDWDYSGSTADSEHHWRQLTKKVCFIEVDDCTLAYPREWDSPQNQEILIRDLQLYAMWADGDVFHIEAFPLDGLSESVDLWGEYLPYDIATGFNEAELKQATEMIVKGYL